MATTSTEWITGLRGPKQWKVDEARRVLAAWRASGKPMAQFARHHGLNAQRLAWWRDRLTTKSTPVTLVPVTVRPSAVAQPGGAALSVCTGSIRVEITDASRVAPGWLAAVIDALERRSA